MNSCLMSRLASRAVIEECEILSHEDIKQYTLSESVLSEKFAQIFLLNIYMKVVFIESTWYV